MNQAAIQERAPSRSNTLASFLNSDTVKQKLAAVAKEFMQPEDLIRMALVAIHRNPQILDCSQSSILAALMDAAELKIKPGGMNGRGYLIPRRNKNTKQLECCFDPGWRGLIDVMRRTGEVKRIETHPVFKNDKFRIVYGLNPVLEHEPCLEGERGQLIGAYALAQFRDGTFQVEHLTEGDIRKIRGASTSQNGPWSSWEDEMARKSAVRRLSKYMPADEATDRAAHLAARTEPTSGEGLEWEPVATAPAEAPTDFTGAAPSRAEAAKAALRRQRAPEPATPPPEAVREPGDDSDMVDDDEMAARIDRGEA